MNRVTETGSKSLSTHGRATRSGPLSYLPYAPAAREDEFTIIDSIVLAVACVAFLLMFVSPHLVARWLGTFVVEGYIAYVAVLWVSRIPPHFAVTGAGFVWLAGSLGFVYLWQFDYFRHYQYARAARDLQVQDLGIYVGAIGLAAIMVAVAWGAVLSCLRPPTAWESSFMPATPRMPIPTASHPGPNHIDESVEAK